MTASPAFCQLCDQFLCLEQGAAHCERGQSAAAIKAMCSLALLVFWNRKDESQSYNPLCHIDEICNQCHRAECSFNALIHLRLT